MNSNQKTARIAGVLYLLMAVFSAFSLVYVDSKFYVPGNAAATASNIKTSEWLFRLGILSNLVGQIIFLFLVHHLYKLLKSVDKDNARLMIILVVASVSVTMLNQLSQFAPVLLLNDSEHLSAFNPTQLQAMSMVFYDLHKMGIFIAEIFWGLWLFPFGTLVFKSGFFPKWLGIFLVLGGIGYLIECLVQFLFPEYKTIGYSAVAISGLAEFAFIFWLLIKGVKVQTLNSNDQ
jgi:hypothetical protein